MSCTNTSPRSIDIELTSRCNLRCKYCYYMNNEGVAYSDLSTLQWLDFIDEMGRAKVLQVCLAGGEPLLRPDFMEIIDALVRNHIRFQILTNGKLVTEALSQSLKNTNRLDSIQVSLDGSRAEVHESMRGQGSFEPAVAAIYQLHAAGLPTTVRVTIHRFNIEDLPNIARLLLDEIGLTYFSTNAVSSLGTCGKYADEIFLSPSQRLRAMNVLAELDKKYPSRIRADAGPLADYHMYHQMEENRRRHQAVPGRGKLVGCGCIFERLAVRADGSFVPCVMLPQLVLGRIGQDELVEVWRHAKALKELRNRVNIPLNRFAECRHCDYIESCTGNCPATAFSLTGEANRPSPDACLQKFKMELAEQGEQLWN